ncbi:MAG: hypothetical protein RL641_604 [Candidatus Parcubacteria bacterium]|jgi:prepilin-type N-terminal cleavage/methylation domain-containing protein
MVTFFEKIKKTFQSNRGVTFIELVVVISIFSIIAGTLLVNFSRFGRNITLQNLAQDMALQINAAQKEAISGRTNDALSTCNRNSDDCAPRYGIYVTAKSSQYVNLLMQSFGGTDGKSLLRYFDYAQPNVRPVNEMLDYGNPCGSGVATECLDNISLGQGNFISAICVGSGMECDTDLTNTSGVHITFKRPFPDAIIKNDNGDRFNYVRITISSPNTEDTSPKDIVVTSLGRISIEKYTPYP